MSARALCRKCNIVAVSGTCNRKIYALRDQRLATNAVQYVGTGAVSPQGKYVWKCTSARKIEIWLSNFIAMRKMKWEISSEKPPCDAFLLRSCSTQVRWSIVEMNRELSEWAGYPTWRRALYGELIVTSDAWRLISAPWYFPCSYRMPGFLESSSSSRRQKRPLRQFATICTTAEKQKQLFSHQENHEWLN